MRLTTANPKRILAIDPTSRGFGFVVLESSTMPIDWGVKAVRQEKEAKTLAKVLQLITHYRPEIVVLEEYKGSRRCARVQSLLEGVWRLATKKGLKSRRVPVARVKKVFGTFRANTKHEIAHAVARQIPELAPHLPRYRKAWMSEDYQMAIFDAAALALTYCYSRRFGIGSATKPAPVELTPVSVPNAI
jgi:Holliday junction resolvasome RuvABC endonuclease subunit